MSLRKQWRPLERSTVGRAPDAYGLYELGDSDGTSLGFGIGVLRDELKEALAYGEPAGFEPTSTEGAGEPTQVRWERATSKAHAERLLDEHC
ncbi:DUF7508 domain-containing protein [Halohasta litorea]|uniref:DUF7508 domain-containing protein n=1 Tax=Halohasta litorea TaxID=869891 RepID=A0ABD6D6B1_9EURY|nr:hypothetical protein [Halohasta litorea]